MIIKQKTKQKTTYCLIFCINFEFNCYDLHTLPVTFLLYNLCNFRVHFRLIYQHGYLNKSSSFGTDQKVSYHFFMSLTQIIKLAVQNGKFCINVQGQKSAESVLKKYFSFRTIKSVKELFNAFKTLSSKSASNLVILLKDKKIKIPFYQQLEIVLWPTWNSNFEWTLLYILLEKPGPHNWKNVPTFCRLSPFDQHIESHNQTKTQW